MSAIENSSLLSPAIISFFTWFPPITSQLVFAAPIPTMLQFRRAQTTGEVSPVPYVAMTFNGILWCLYGWLRSDMTLIVANTSAAILGTLYSLTFARYKPKSMSMLPYMTVVVCLLTAVITIVLMCDEHSAKQYIGLLGCTIGVTMFSGPLGAIRSIVRDKSTRSLPFAFTVASFLCCVAWSGYGWLVIDDAYIYVPNLLGLAAATVQLSLFLVYGVERAHKGGGALLSTLPGAEEGELLGPKAV